jgi:hypothetical protein
MFLHITFSTISFKLSELETSVFIAMEFCPISDAVFSASFIFMSAIYTFAPHSASVFDIALPIPLAPPVTIATFPDRSIFIVCLTFSLFVFTSCLFSLSPFLFFLFFVLFSKF